MSTAELRLFDVPIDRLNLHEALERTDRFIASGGFHHIVTPGPEFLLEASAHPRFRTVLQRADLRLPDGGGLRYGAWLTGQRSPGRVPGIDFVEALLARAAEKGYSVFFYGGSSGAAEEAAGKLLARYPKLNIAGFEAGHRGPWGKVQDRHVINRIRCARPDILLVALGSPKQDLWIDTHRAALQGVSVAIGVGRTFDYLSGRIQRAHPLMRRLNLEWLDTWLHARRFYQPQQRRQRVANATVHFIKEILRHGR